MKRLLIILVLSFGVSTFSYPQTSQYDGRNEGGLFGYGMGRGSDYGIGLSDKESTPGSITPLLPGGHGYDNDQTSPLGSGILLLVGLGAAYAMKSKRKE